MKVRLLCISLHQKICYITFFEFLNLGLERWKFCLLIIISHFYYHYNYLFSSLVQVRGYLNESGNEYFRISFPHTRNSTNCFYMKHYLLLICLSFFFSSQAQIHKWGETSRLTVENNYLVDPEGNQVMLHGVMDTPSPYFSGYRFRDGDHT